MKTLILSMLMLTLASISNAQNVNIPDTAFLYALIDKGLDTNGDSLFSYAEAEAIISLDVDGKSISDMTGIEAFVNLDTLWCGSNQFTSLDVSKNTALTILNCNGSQLTSLDVSGCTALIYLHCIDNQLTSLDVSKNTALTTLFCVDNQLTNLDVSNNTALTTLFCWSNQLTSLDVSGCTALTGLQCYSNQLASLDVSNNTALTWLNCSYNQLTSLDISKNIALTDLQLMGMPTLYEVCVWEMPFPPDDVFFWVDIGDSPNAYFSTDCLTNIVNIPDVHFKSALISAGVDTSGDGEISYVEAEDVTILGVYGDDISDMTGIEAFVR